MELRRTNYLAIRLVEGERRRQNGTHVRTRLRGNVPICAPKQTGDIVDLTQLRQTLAAHFTQDELRDDWQTFVETHRPVLWMSLLRIVSIYPQSSLYRHASRQGTGDDPIGFLQTESENLPIYEQHAIKRMDFKCFPKYPTIQISMEKSTWSSSYGFTVLHVQIPHVEAHHKDEWTWVKDCRLRFFARNSRRCSKSDDTSPMASSRLSFTCCHKIKIKKNRVIMADNEQKAIQLMAEAEKKLHSSKGFFGSLFGGSSKVEEAVECYQRAANMFKMAKKWGAAGNAFCEAAMFHAKAGSKHDAATNYVDAANCYKKSDSNETSGTAQTLNAL
uniref:Alpha-soluble NSF attachment protein n=1 Tax=Timema poppense TaxID=170557 RepID=A0A7R9D0Z2_TIMPO|nr:unnamed protein product [Timema poppensis]